MRGVYPYEAVSRPKGHELYDVADKIRNGDFAYLSKESVLSDLGIIS